MPGGAQRDPVSLQWDRGAQALLVRAAASGGWEPTVVPSRPWARAFDEGGLTRDERAFQRALYFNAKQLPGPRVSLAVEWGRVEARGRRVRVRLFSYASGLAHVAADPGGAWWDKPELRSAGLGAGRRRFG